MTDRDLRVEMDYLTKAVAGWEDVQEVMSDSYMASRQASTIPQLADTTGELNQLIDTLNELQVHIRNEMLFLGFHYSGMIARNLRTVARRYVINEADNEALANELKEMLDNG